MKKLICSNRPHRWWLAALTFCVMALIFCLSAQPGPSSSALSGQVSAHLHENGFGTAVAPRWFSSSNWNANVRKWAHVYLYAVLGASMALTVRAFAGRRFGFWANAGTAALLCTVYAATDEFHQLFVPGRAGMWQDVFVDAIGYLPGVLAVLLLCWLQRRAAGKRRRRPHESAASE